MDIDIFHLFFILVIYLLGTITTTLSKVISDLLSEPYHNWKYKKSNKNYNVESVTSLIADFYSIWDLFKCRSIPHINLEKELVNTCRQIHSLVSKNEGDFQKNDIGESIKDVCKKFIALNPQTDDGSRWSQGAENQIDELCIEFKKYKEMLEKR